MHVLVPSGAETVAEYVRFGNVVTVTVLLAEVSVTREKLHALVSWSGTSPVTVIELSAASAGVASMLPPAIRPTTTNI